MKELAEQYKAEHDEYLAYLADDDHDAADDDALTLAAGLMDLAFQLANAVLS